MSSLLLLLVFVSLQIEVKGNDDITEIIIQIRNNSVEKFEMKALHSTRQEHTWYMNQPSRNDSIMCRVDPDYVFCLCYDLSGICGNYHNILNTVYMMSRDSDFPVIPNFENLNSGRFELKKTLKILYDNPRFSNALNVIWNTYSSQPFKYESVQRSEISSSKYNVTNGIEFSNTHGLDINKQLDTVTSDTIRDPHTMMIDVFNGTDFSMQFYCPGGTCPGGEKMKLMRMKKKLLDLYQSQKDIYPCKPNSCKMEDLKMEIPGVYLAMQAELKKSEKPVLSFSSYRTGVLRIHYIPQEKTPGGYISVFLCFLLASPFVIALFCITKCVLSCDDQFIERTPIEVDEKHRIEDQEEVLRKKYIRKFHNIEEGDSTIEAKYLLGEMIEEQHQKEEAAKNAPKPKRIVSVEMKSDREASALGSISSEKKLQKTQESEEKLATCIDNSLHTAQSSGKVSTPLVTPASSAGPSQSTPKENQKQEGKEIEMKGTIGRSPIVNKPYDERSDNLMNEMPKSNVPTTTPNGAMKEALTPNLK